MAIRTMMSTSERDLMEVLVAASVVGALTVFLLLAVLARCERSRWFREETEALAQLIKSPPPPTFVQGGQVPHAVKQQPSGFLLQNGFFAGCVG